jgi:para-nitrobenzyl esterase
MTALDIGGACLSAQSLAATAWQGSAVVTTAFGDVEGFADNATTWAWKAIPYARPPVGELRWQAPQDPEPWSAVRQIRQFCNNCPQVASDNSTGSRIKGDEDCLYLNIWRPQSLETKLPVYFWIHGGSNKVGSADPYYGAVMAGRSNMVVVTINYRLGPLGWFTHPALRDGEDALNSSGNYCTLDIIKALAWVRDNIEGFGGNAQNVTIAGQSAGGVNVFTLLISPLASGLFHRGIAQSGSLEPSSQQKGDDYASAVIESLLVLDGTPRWQARSVRTGMTNAEIRGYLRSKTAAQFFAATSELTGNPDVFNDGAVIHEDGPDAFDDPEKYNQVPIIIGSTSEEGKLFMYLAGLYEWWGNNLYQAVGKLGSQYGRMKGLDSLAEKMSAHESQPGVYCYVFQYGQYRRAGYNAWPTDQGPTEKMSWAVALGACHALDIPFNFGIIGSFPLFQGVDELIFRDDNRPGWQSLSDAMMSYAAQFARTGNPNPNTAGLPEWTQWPQSDNAGAPKFLLFDANDTEALIEMSADVQ